MRRNSRCRVYWGFGVVVWQLEVLAEQSSWLQSERLRPPLLGFA